MNPFRTRREDGAAVVEMALVLPVLLLLVFGIIQFGIAFNRSQGIHAAAREGARFASVGQDQTTILERVRDSQAGFDRDDLAVEVLLGEDGTGGLAPDPPCSGAGQLVTVRAYVEDNDDAYYVRIPLLPTFTVEYEATATFRCEGT